MKKATKAKELFYIKRVMVIETTIQIAADDENEAVLLVLKGQGEEIYTETHAHIKGEE